MILIKIGSHARILNYKQKYLGLAEVANILDIRKQTAQNWKTRGHLPKPLIQLAMGPVWSYWQIRKWIEET